MMASLKYLLDNFNISFISELTGVAFPHSRYDFLVLGVTSDFQMHHGNLKYYRLWILIFFKQVVCLLKCNEGARWGCTFFFLGIISHLPIPYTTPAKMNPDSYCLFAVIWSGISSPNFARLIPILENEIIRTTALPPVV